LVPGRAGDLFVNGLRLATIGAVYSMCMILFLAIVGVVVFKEHMSMTEIAGMLMAVASLILLTRFT
jgi:multidrug transporter EmrE-like cation transporter